MAPDIIQESDSSGFNEEGAKPFILYFGFINNLKKHT